MLMQRLPLKESYNNYRFDDFIVLMYNSLHKNEWRRVQIRMRQKGFRFPAWMIQGFTAAILPAAFLFCLVTAGSSQAETSAWQALQEAIDQAEAGDVVILTEDVKADESDSALVIPDGTVLTLDLNGFTINRNQKTHAGRSGAVIQVPSGAVLTVTDSEEISTGVITGGNSSDGGGIRNSGTLILEGGCVTGNVAATAGGGIVNYGTLIVTGGKVTGNTAGKWGGGIYNAAEGSLTVDADIVFGNSAPREENIRNSGSMKIVGGDTVQSVAITDYLDLLAALPALVLVLILTFAVHLDKYLDKRQKKVMDIICVLVFTLILQNYLENWLSLNARGTLPRTLAAIYGYAVRPAILAMFLYIVRPGKRFRLVWILIGINAAIYLTALFSPMAFSIAREHYEKGPLGQTCLIVSALLFIYLFCLTVRVFHPQKRRETWIPIIVTVVIGAAVALDYTVEYNNQPVSFLTIGIVISCVFYYIWLHLQFVREHEDGLRAAQRIQIMRTQIQPHFLYNTIATFKALCRKNPEQAADVADKFGMYLRQNLNSLDVSGRIPFEKELQHTKLYADIEMVRFDNIRMEYDIRDGDFTVPPLTLQPMVENAIRHGVRSRKEGVVRVLTRKSTAGHEIVIQDNGKGFDPKEAETQEGIHLGIRNVRERIESMCGGTLTIQSTEEVGTTVTITIPDRRETA